MPTITDPLTRMQYLVAKSATWRVWNGITTGTEAEQLAAALAKTGQRFVAMDTILGGLPFALVEGTPSANATRIAEGGGAFKKFYRIRVVFFDEFTGDASSVDAVRSALADLSDNVAGVLNDLDTASGSNDTLYYEERTEVEAPMLVEVKNDAAYLHAIHEFTGWNFGSETVA